MVTLHKINCGNHLTRVPVKSTHIPNWHLRSFWTHFLWHALIISIGIVLFLLKKIYGSIRLNVPSKLVNVSVFFPSVVQYDDYKEIARAVTVQFGLHMERHMDASILEGRFVIQIMSVIYKYNEFIIERQSTKSSKSKLNYQYLQSLGCEILACGVYLLYSDVIELDRTWKKTLTFPSICIMICLQVYII